MKKVMIVFLFGGMLLVGLGGCEAQQHSMFGWMRTPEEGKISKEELRGLLNVYRDYYVAEMKELANHLDVQNGTRRTQRTNLQMRSRIITAIDVMLEPFDPVVAFVEIWGFALRMRLYVEEGEGMDLYGEQQPMVIEVTQKLEAEIERIGRLFLDEEKFQQARENLVHFAKQNPIRGTYSNMVVMAVKEEKEGFNPLKEIIGVPLAPFSAMRGVDRTADAVYQFRNTAERFTDVVKELPERAHWEAQLLMDELLEAPQLQSVLASTEQFSESSARFSAVAEQLTAMLEDGASQDPLNQTLASVQAAASEVRVAIESLDRTGRTLKEMAVEVEKAAVASKALIELFLPVQTSRDEKSGPPFTMRDFDAMIGRIGQTADKINQVVVNLRQAADTPRTVPQIQGLVDHLTKRAFYLLLVFFGLLLVYQLLLRYVFRKASGSGQSA